VVEEGPRLKRWMAVSRGSAHPIQRRLSHVRIVLSDGKA
jgi:ribosomal protein L22